MKLHVITTKYTCGGCTVCCNVVAVRDLGKPFYSRCEHQLESGCAAYASRPQSCRDFVCAWVAGLMGEGLSWRPDRAGLLFSLRRYDDGLWLEIHESAVGALKANADRLEFLIRRISDRIERHERVVGVRMHHLGDRIGLGFAADAERYPGSADVSNKMNRYGWVNGDATRQIFQVCHDPPENAATKPSPEF